MFGPIAAVALVGLMAAFATNAYAFPSKTVACTGCHSGASIAISTTLVSTVGTTATYSFNAPGADSVVVFDGATKLFTFLAPTGQFAVATGKTYTLYAVTGPSTGDGVGSKTVSPVAPVTPPADTTAPVTTSDAKASYVSSAAIKLTATDAGTGVAATYYKLDGGAQVSGTAINVTALGAHTLEYWSVDKAGNTETHKTASFTITAPVVVDTTAPVTATDAKASYVSTATIKLTATDAGSGVATTYYILDGGIQIAGTSVTTSVLGAHTLEYWSVDKAGNVELRKTAAFTVTAPVVTPTPGKGHTVKVRVPHGKHSRATVAMLTDKTTGAKFTTAVGKRGVAVFKDVPAGTYKLSIKTTKGVKVLRTVVVQDPLPETDHETEDRD